MAKDKAAKERARAERKRKARLAGEERRRKVEKAAMRVEMDLLQGNLTAEGLAFVINEGPAETVFSKTALASSTAVLEAIKRSHIAQCVSAISDACDDDLFFDPAMLPGMLVYPVDNSGELEAMDFLWRPLSLEGPDASYRAVDTILECAPDSPVAAWVVGTSDEPWPRIALCGLRDGRRAAFLVLDDEWAPIKDVSALAPLLKRTIEWFAEQEGYDEVVAGETAKTLFASRRSGMGTATAPDASVEHHAGLQAAMPEECDRVRKIGQSLFSLFASAAVAAQLNRQQLSETSHEWLGLAGEQIEDRKRLTKEVATLQREKDALAARLASAERRLAEIPAKSPTPVDDRRKGGGVQAPASASPTLAQRLHAVF